MRISVYLFASDSKKPSKLFGKREYCFFFVSQDQQHDLLPKDLQAPPQRAKIGAVQEIFKKRNYVQYFIKRNEKIQGPFTREQLMGFAKAKKVTGADLVGSSAQGPFQELKTVWESIKNPPAAPASSEPVQPTIETAPTAPQASMPVVQERFKGPAIDTGGAAPVQPALQTGPPEIPPIIRSISNMQSSEFLDRLESLLVPHDYRKRITKNVPDAWRFYRKGAYIFAAVPYSSIPKGDYGNKYVKSEIKKIVFALPLFADKGLFLLHYGAAAEWEPHKEHHKVDKTALLRSIIMQSIQYVDPESGANYNSRTAWGPIKFGFSGKVIEKIERLCAEL